MCSLELQSRSTSKPNTSSASEPEIQSDPSQKVVVSVRKAFKHYGRKNSVVVLDGFNMTVMEGTIYGLLGASGCGKTTLLNCILGQKKLKSGKIWILGGEPGTKNSGVPGPQVGYMPQEVGLYGDFTIKETLKYFGWIAGMANNSIQERSEELIQLFLLPDNNQRINTLSGGQQRRVSLASALLHKPELLILDEPTVGLDPVLRENIWRHLKNICETQRTSIILTTHYIEETKQADVVGLMRAGKLLAEDSPQKLLRQYETEKLEDVFFKLSTQQSENELDSKKVDDCEVFELTSGSSRLYDYLPVLKRNHMKALIWKNIMWWIRNIPSLAFMLVDYNAEEEAKQSVLYRETYASITIKSNYSEALQTRIEDWRSSEPWDIHSSTIEVLRDVSNKYIANYLMIRIYDAFQKFMEDYLETCEINREALKAPIKWETPIYGVAYPTFTDFAVPGALLTMSFLLATVLTSAVMLVERNEASFDRTFVFGITETELLTGHIVCEGVIMVLQVVLELSCAFTFFDVTQKGSLALVVLLTVLTGFCGMCYGMLVSCLYNTFTEVNLVVAATFLPTVLLSGVLWPLEGIPSFIQPITSIFPLTKPTESMRGILQKSWNLRKDTVFMGFLSISIWSIIIFLISVMFLKLKRH